MKTINDLVDKLNATFDYVDFYIEKDDELETYTIFMRVPNNTDRLIEMSQHTKRWMAQPSFGLVSIDVQKEIMDFVYTTDKEHWFDEPEKKYNIVIGKDVGTYGDCVKTAYRKKDKGIEVWDSANEGSLTSDKYIFTESEIEDLKATLPENMAKIVDLGKAEVKDD